MTARYTPPTLPHIAALYACVSSKPQGAEENDKTSLKTQLAALRAKAAELAYAVVDEYIYQDMYAEEELIERPNLSRLREDARAKNTAHIAILHDEWERLGIGLDFVTETLEDSPLGTQRPAVPIRVRDLNRYSYAGNNPETNGPEAGLLARAAVDTAASAAGQVVANTWDHKPLMSACPGTSASACLANARHTLP